MLITHHDGRVHFSDLKQMAKSPAHYAHHCKTDRTPTRDMLIGSAVNARVLGQSPRRPLLVWRDSPTRATNAYRAFARATSAPHTHCKMCDLIVTQTTALPSVCPKCQLDTLELRGACDILTESEWDESAAIADAILSDPCARALLGASEPWRPGENDVRYEVPLSWTDNGIPCATTGIDIVGPGYLADLKVVHNAEPEYLQKHALRMMWHAQLVWYRSGFNSEHPIQRALLKDQTDDGMRAAIRERLAMQLHLLCVESSPPHCVTVLTLSPEVIEAGEKCIRAWMERLKVCAESRAYPGYAQSPVTWALPEWMSDEGFDD